MLIDTSAADKPTVLAVVAIGRNEGERLRTCLTSALASGLAQVVVYVDSGSTDGSVAMAQGLGCQVVNLNMAIPFTAARARNEGFALARQLAPGLTHVQFVDGDCELVLGWLPAALQFLDDHPQVAAACGRRRERFPQNSIYNQLCDIEWNTPVGQAKACGGDVLMRANALQAVGGYRASLIAGEEPELCVRLRAAGWQIWRLDQEMTLHDAAILRFGQWWNRSRRAGYAFAEGAALHGAAPERHNVAATRRALLWAVALPLLIAASAGFTRASVLFVLVYPAQVMRLVVQSKLPGKLAWWHALALVVSKFAEAQGALKFYKNRWLGKAGTLIEYK